MNGWHHVNSEKKCPICGHDSWCMLSDNGEVCICMRTPGRYPTKSGTGWIYGLKPRTENGPMRTSGPTKSVGAVILNGPKPPPAVDVDAYFNRLAHGEELNNEQTRLSRELMRRLSIPCDYFIAMDVRGDRKAHAVAFPMRDAEGKVTGIRYRKLATGQKWAFKGGHDGLFYIPDGHDASELYVCEGPTDMLAAYAIGLTNVFGRSCCTAGAPLLGDVAKRLGTQHVTIIADDDEPKKRPDGSTFTPGIDGARRLANDLALPYRIVFPAKGFKDIREWYAKGGLTLEKFNAEAREVESSVVRVTHAHMPTEACS